MSRSAPADMHSPLNSPVKITDSHCHLDFPDFDGELEALLDRAAAEGVHRMVSICTKLANVNQVKSIAEKYASVFWAAGTHPMSVASEPMATLDELLDLAQHPKLVGIGETGLDYYYTQESKTQQQESLLIHIEAARQTKLPLIIHSRDADEDMARILSEEYKKGHYTCVMHCFSSSKELAQAALDLGFYLSMSGITAFKKSHELRDIFANAPQDRILVETDSPYLAPPPYRGKRNEPAYVSKTAEAAAQHFGLEYGVFAKQCEENFERLFWKAALNKDQL